MKIEVSGQLTEVGQFNNEPGHGLVVDTGRGEVFIGGLEREDVARVAKLLYQNVSVQIEVAPAPALDALKQPIIRPSANATRARIRNPSAKPGPPKVRVQKKEVTRELANKPRGKEFGRL